MKSTTFANKPAFNVAMAKLNNIIKLKPKNPQNLRPHLSNVTLTINAAGIFMRPAKEIKRNTEVLCRLKK